MSKLDECAKALAKEEGQSWAPQWDQMPDWVRHQYHNRVRAILKELREPTPEMIDAGASRIPVVMDYPVKRVVRNVLQAAIDAVLEEE